MKDEDREEGLETLFAVRIREDRIKLMRDIFHLFILIFGFSAGMALMGAFQYWNCYQVDRDTTLMQCFSVRVKEVRHK